MRATPTLGAASRLDRYRVSPTSILSALFRVVWCSGPTGREKRSHNQVSKLLLVSTMRVWQCVNDQLVKGRFGTYDSRLVGWLILFVCADERQVFGASDGKCL